MNSSIRSLLSGYQGTHRLVLNLSKVIVAAVTLAISLLLTGCPSPAGNNGPSSISTADEFVKAITSDLTQDYVLAADIDLSGYSNWEPIGSKANPFTGSLDGNGYTISHLTIRSGGSYLGFFGYLGEGARISNIKLEDVNVSGGDHFGGLAGYNGGTITNCYTAGSVTGIGVGLYIGGLVGDNMGAIIDSHSAGIVGDSNDASYIGGLVGQNPNGGTITNSYTTGPVTGNFAVGGLAGSSAGKIINSYASGVVSGQGGGYVGGLVGSENGEIKNSYATGAVSGEGVNIGGLIGYIHTSAFIRNSYAKGSVIGKDRVGGLVGHNNGSVITSCYATGSVSGKEYDAGGLVGRSEGEIRDSYATGAVSGKENVGGFAGALVGTHLSSTVENSYSAASSVTGSSGIGGFVGLLSGTVNVNDCFYDNELLSSMGDSAAKPSSSIDMKNQTTFINEGWDFTNIWAIDSLINHGYPYLLD